MASSMRLYVGTMCRSSRDHVDLLSDDREGLTFSSGGDTGFVSGGGDTGFVSGGDTGF